MSNPQQHLLVVDDDPVICDLLDKYLTSEGFFVYTAQDGETMRHLMASEPIDLAILDLMMPGEDGLTLTRYLRERSNVAVIILTAKSETVDRIIGLEMGADDYVVKPFDLRELLARVKSVLRRHTRATSPANEEADPSESPVSKEQIAFAGWRLDLGLYHLISPQGDKVPLTTGEFELLIAFVNHSNRVLSRDELLNLLHNRDAGPYDRSIDVQVGRLRRKIEVDPSQPQLIITVRGAGYLFTPSVRTIKSNESL